MSAQAIVDLARRRFTADEYQRMGQTGILDEDDRVELLDGEIVQMTPIGPVHASIVDRLTRLLVQRLGDRAVVRVQNPIRLNPHSEPQPDLVVARDRADFYASSHPAPDDVLLVVEVADSSLALDRAVKMPLYARARVPEVWLIDLAARVVVVHRDPRGGAYADVHTASPDEQLRIEALDDVAVTVTDVLGADA